MALSANHQITPNETHAIRMQLLSGEFFREPDADEIAKLMYYNSSYTQPCTSCCTQCAPPNCCLATYANYYY